MVGLLSIEDFEKRKTIIGGVSLTKKTCLACELGCGVGCSWSVVCAVGRCILMVCGVQKVVFLPYQVCRCGACLACMCIQPTESLQGENYLEKKLMYS